MSLSPGVIAEIWSRHRWRALPVLQRSKRETWRAVVWPNVASTAAEADVPTVAVETTWVLFTMEPGSIDGRNTYKVVADGKLVVEVDEQ